jgi:NADP-dependent 3-hydroxy acid dehydrogenase YdfG
MNTFGRVDVMINNAGLMAIAPIAELRVDEWDHMIDINIKGVMYGIAAALPPLRAARRGALHQHFISCRYQGIQPGRLGVQRHQVRSARDFGWLTP